MSRARILATGPVDSIAIEILQPFGSLLVAEDCREDSLLSLLDGTVGLIIRSEGRASAKVIREARDLKVIGRPGVGYDTVDIQAATKHKIPVVFTPGAGAPAVAEAALALMLSLSKRLPFWDRQFKQGNWQSRFESKPGDLEGATLGIIGFGRIGQRVADLARAFDMTLIAYDPYGSEEAARRGGVELVDLADLLGRSDFITLHALLTEETRGLINGERLRKVKRGAFLINLARGGLIESLDVLQAALEDGTLAGVGLDVFEPEPPDATHPLFRLPNCQTAPHALGMSQRAMERVFKSMAEDMAAVLKGESPRNVVNPEVFARNIRKSKGYSLGSKVRH